MLKRHELSWVVNRSLVVAVASALAGCVGISGHQVVQKRIVVAGGAMAQVHVECPSGKKVLGGGFSVETSDNMNVSDSTPSYAGNLIDHGWTVTVRNADTQERQTTVVAICADAQ